MTPESMLSLILKRCKDAKDLVDIEELSSQGYTSYEVADYLYRLAMAQAKLDIIPITIVETSLATGESVDVLAELMKNHLEGDKKRC